MITREIAEQLIAKLREETDLFVDVINEKGIIQASFHPKNVGTFHKVAFDLMQDSTEMVDVGRAIDSLKIPQSVVSVVKENGLRVGCIGVSGPPDEVRQMAMMVRLMLETMLEYESKYESFHKYNSSRDIFNQALMYGENITKEVLIARADRLGVQTDCLRISMFVVAEPKTDFSALIQRSMENPFASQQDIVAVSRSNRIAIFKHLERSENLLSSYRYHVEEYLKWWRDELLDMGIRAQFNIGTIQDSLVRYRHAYQHAVWLVTSAKCQQEINWFYDYTDLYFRSIVPIDISRNVFETYASLIDKPMLAQFPELFDTLEQCNYNFIQASQKLFIHKNTIAFRLDKIKTCLNVNPVKNPRDRNFVNNLSFFLHPRA